MTERRFIERGKPGEWSLLVKGADVLAVRSIPHLGQRYYSTEDRPNRPDKQSQYQLDVEEVVERYASGTTDVRDPRPAGPGTGRWSE